MKNEILSELLIGMYRADQAMRESHETSGGAWDARVDEENSKKLGDIIARLGWPTVTMVGAPAAHAAALIARHADADVPLQKRCLALMRTCPKGEVDLADIAYLEDRILVNQGLPQLYGTQFRQNWRGEHVPRPIMGPPEALDMRRKRMGLGTFDEGVREMYEKYPVVRKSWLMRLFGR